ncbi:MAG: tyrosine-type recombinase/integrase [Piscinibacter sp.]
MGIRQLPNQRYRLQLRRASLKVDQVFDTYAQAQAAMDQYLGAKPADGSRRKTGGPTVDEAWALYRESRDFLEKKPTTIRSEETHVKPALLFFDSRPVRSLTPDDIDAFIVRETKAGKAPDTIRNAVASLSAILNFCIKKQIVKANVTIGVSRPSKERTVRRMPEGHQGALMKVLAHPKYRYRAVARLALLVRETGARPGEWASARWDDVHLDKQRVTFKDTKYKRMARTVPLTRASMELLTAQLEDIMINQFEQFSASEWVFPTVGLDGELRPIAYTGTMRDMKKDELIPKALRTHNGRHEYISTLVESSDLDDSRIMSLVGHHSPASMQIYTHARNVRFLPQLEALEASRRKERTQEISKAFGVPTKVIDAYLAHRRALEASDSLEDGGNELLYEAETVGTLSKVAERMGKTEEERLRTMLEIQKQAAKRPTAGAPPVSPAPPAASNGDAAARAGKRRAASQPTKAKTGSKRVPRKTRA